MSLDSIPWCHLKLILLSALLLFCCSLDLCSANDEFGVGTTDDFDDVLTVSSFSYPQTTLRPYDLRYIRANMGDKLLLRGLSFHGFHGVLPEERKLGQKFVVDVDAWMDLKAAGKSDHLSDTISYTDIYDIAKEILEGSPQNLLETVAQKIAVTTLTNHKQISAVRVKVEKPHVAVQGPVDYLGVEILRRRSDLSE